MADTSVHTGWVALTVFVVLATSCEQSTLPRPAQRAGPLFEAAATALVRPAAGKGSRQQKHPRDSWVFLDGRPIGVLRHSELPPGLEPRMVLRGEPFPLFPLAEYLVRLGVDLEAIREVHLDGGQRTAILSGAELRRVQDKLCFAFTRADSGRPRMDWPSERVEASTKIDILRSISLYRDKPAPVFDWDVKALHFGDGKPIQGVPYADPEETRRGVRVYVDGRLAVVVRRKNLPPGVEAATGGGDLKLGPLLEAMGVELSKVERATILDGDVTGEVLDAKQLNDAATLRLLEQAGGAGELRAGDAADPKRVTAISLQTSETLAGSAKAPKPAP